MEQESSRLDWARLAAGVAILAIGAVLFVERSGLARGWEFWDFWPLILIGIGGTRLAGSADAHQRQSALLMAFVGCWLLIASLGLFGLDYGDSWPLAVVAVGLSIVLTAWSLWRAAKGLFLVLLGAWLQLTTLGLFGLSMQTTWPFVIVMVGIWFIITSFFPERVYRSGDRNRSSREVAS